MNVEGAEELGKIKRCKKRKNKRGDKKTLFPTEVLIRWVRAIIFGNVYKTHKSPVHRMAQQRRNHQNDALLHEYFAIYNNKFCSQLEITIVASHKLQYK